MASRRQPDLAFKLASFLPRLSLSRTANGARAAATRHLPADPAEGCKHAGYSMQFWTLMDTGPDDAEAPPVSRAVR